MAKKIIKGALGAAGSLLGIKKKSKKPDEVAPVMPIADDEAVRRAKKRAIAKQMGRGGRRSTILTENEDSLGG